MMSSAGASGPAPTTWRGVVALTGVLHVTAFAYILLFTRDRPDWTMGVFYKYASLMRAGRVPYRDFSLEYPPLAAAVLWLPRLVTHTLVAYRAAFALEIGVVDLLGASVALWAIARFAPQLPPWGVVLAQPLWLTWAGRSLVFDRFDLAPAVLIVLALVLFVERRVRLAWVMIGLATALKLYPVVILPLFVVAGWRHRTRGQAAGDIMAWAAAVLVPSLLVARGDLVAVTTFLRYHLARGLEIETLYASGLMIGRLVGQQVSQMWGYGGNEIVAPLAPVLAALSGPLTVVVLGVIYHSAWRRRREWTDPMTFFLDLVRLSALATLAFMLVGKVLSPQYLLWLYPLLPLVGHRHLLLWTLFGVTLLLSNWIFPEHYYLLVLFRPREIGVLLVRNILLLVLGALLLTAHRPRTWSNLGALD